LGVSRQGEFKNNIKIFWQKVRVENFSKNFDNNFDVSFSSTFFVLSHFRVFFSNGSSKTLQKNVSQNKSCRKSIFSRFFLSRFWAFLGEGSSKTRQKNIKKINLTLVLFWPLTHLPTTGVTDFFLLAAPWSHAAFLPSGSRMLQMPLTQKKSSSGGYRLHMLTRGVARRRSAARLGRSGTRLARRSVLRRRATPRVNTSDIKLHMGAAGHSG
jgi:hypothetical protein